jgi:1-phosphatidylinositol phosphodiesterase
MSPPRNCSAPRTTILAIVAASLLPTCRQTHVPPPPPSLPDRTPIPLSDWMRSLRPNTPPSALSIPGTHDSAATREPLPGTAACQSLSIPDQLAAGIRFLDVRGRHLRNTFAIYHGTVDQQLTFDQVLASCRQFLAAHPSETLILSIKEESDPADNTRSFAQTLDAYIAPDPALWHLEPRIPTLRQAAGKIVLFRRFSAAAPLGIDASRWPDNRTFTLPGPIPLRVQDRYVVPDTAAKWDDIRALLDEARSANPQTLFVNFTSGYRPSLLGIPDIPAVSRDIHQRLVAYLVDHPSARLGIVLLDFASPSLSTAILRTNFPVPANAGADD